MYGNMYAFHDYKYKKTYMTCGFMLIPRGM